MPAEAGAITADQASTPNGDDLVGGGGVYIIDVETQCLIGDAAIPYLGVACLVIYDVARDMYTITDCDSRDWQQRIDILLESSYIVVGWNLIFDFAVLSSWMAPDTCRNFYDPLPILRRATSGKPVGSLDDVCRRTIGEGKVGDGAEAPALWRADRFAELHTYCMNDVRLLRNLLRHARDNAGWLQTVSGPARIDLPRVLEELL